MDKAPIIVLVAALMFIFMGYMIGCGKTRDDITKKLIENEILLWNIDEKTGEKYLIHIEGDGHPVKKVQF